MEKIYEYEGIKEISILDYYPNKLQDIIELTPEQHVVNQFILDFKNGHRPASILAAKLVSKTIINHFDLTNSIVFIPIPASTREETYKRYNLFSYCVSQNCKITDGRSWVKNWNEVEKKHLSKDHTIQDEKNRWFVDYSKIKQTNVIIFDDVVTTGETSGDFVTRLENCGATIIGKIFLARSFYKKGHQETL